MSFHDYQLHALTRSAIEAVLLNAGLIVNTVDGFVPVAPENTTVAWLGNMIGQIGFCAELRTKTPIDTGQMTLLDGVLFTPVGWLHKFAGS